MSEKNRLELLGEVFNFKNGDIVAEKVIASRERISRAFGELFSGYGKTADDVLNETAIVDGYNGVVIMKNISFYTFCEHHFLPFYGVAHIAYKPKRVITGIGKLVRLVRDVHSRRMQIQELMTRDIAEDIMRVLDAEGAFVLTQARHLCICSRGPGDDGAITEVQYGCGSLLGENRGRLFGSDVAHDDGKSIFI